MLLCWNRTPQRPSNFGIFRFASKQDVSVWSSNEPPHDKTNKMVCAPSEDSDQPGIRPVWTKSSLSAGRKLGSLATHWAHSEDSDQTVRIPRLIWVFAGRTVLLLVLSWGGSNEVYSLSNIGQVHCWFIQPDYYLSLVTRKPFFGDSRSGESQTGLLTYRSLPESWNFGFPKYRYYTV